MLKDLKSLPEWQAACLRYRYDITRFAVEGLNMTKAAGQEVTWQQRLLFLSVARDGSRTSVASGHGCFGRDTPIMLATGEVVPVQNIRANDLLMGDDHKSQRRVIQLIRGIENLYKFNYSNGDGHVFNESHILCLVGRAGKYKYKKVKVIVRDYLQWSEQKKRRFLIYKTTSDQRTLKFSISSVESLGEGRYYGFTLTGNQKFLSGDNTVLHNTGKTRSAGIIALWHLLFFEESVMMFTAPQIDQLRKLVWKEISICLARMKTTHLAWLADYVTVLAETVYVKGYAKTWHVIAKTAPKNQPTNLAGQHGDNYFLWGDEACGIDDAIMDVAMGALTHKNNRACLTSQPARSSGFFFDTHHKLSIKVGGVWTSLVFNGERSPIVSIKKLKESLMQYGSRDDPQYMIRIRGIFPDRANEFLVTQSMASRMYDKRAAIKKKHKHFGYFLSVDVGGGVGRDDSCITVGKVWGHASYGDYARRIDVIDIPLCNNRADIHVMTGVIEECILRYPNITILLDANGAGIGLAQHLRSLGIYFREIIWGGECFENANKKLYVNKRSQANVCLARAVDQGRIKIHTRRHKAKLEEQITRIPYIFDEKSRYKVLSKEEMRRKGLTSPDMIDTLAFMYMEGINFTPAYDGQEEEVPAKTEEGQETTTPKTTQQENVNDLKAIAEDID
ncbi:TPA: terminase [Acinetobacter nosocomialis]|nr:terminase [Acinetobacter nosocomialis]